MSDRLLVQAYIAAVLEHGDTTGEEDDDLANERYERLRDALAALVASRSWPASLAELLEHSDRSVRCWAATHLLRAKPESAIDTLEELATQKDIAGFNAKMVLREWRAGRLQPP
jgi:hypothetical protein